VRVVKDAGGAGAAERGRGQDAPVFTRKGKDRGWRLAWKGDAIRSAKLGRCLTVARERRSNHACRRILGS